jgi:hypothetical protein
VGVSVLLHVSSSSLGISCSVLGLGSQKVMKTRMVDRREKDAQKNNSEIFSRKSYYQTTVKFSWTWTVTCRTELT